VDSQTSLTMQKEITDIQKERRELYKRVVDAFGVKYGWLGSQAARELLISAATWNLQKHSNPPFRYRTHVMLAWQRGYLKSTMIREMKEVLGDDMVSIIGKVSDAAMRGSVSGGTFTPPKPLQTPIVASTEYGQTDFSDELLNVFLNQLEEGHTNVALNKIGQIPESQKKNIQNNFKGAIDFKANNEYDLHSDFVFWGATYDPSKLDDNALRSRFNVVTPEKPLDYTVTKSADNNPSVSRQLDTDTKRSVGRHLKMEKNMPTRFKPTENLYKKYNIGPRESRDIQSYMAARNWWGLDVNPEIMEDYISYLQQSRRLSTMRPEDRVFEVIFDNPTTYGEIKKRTGFSKKEIYRMMQKIGAERINLRGNTEWVIWSGMEEKQEFKNNTDNDEGNNSGGFLSDQLSND